MVPAEHLRASRLRWQKPGSAIAVDRLGGRQPGFVRRSARPSGRDVGRRLLLLRLGWHEDQRQQMGTRRHEHLRRRDGAHLPHATDHLRRRPRPVTVVNA